MNDNNNDLETNHTSSNNNTNIESIYFDEIKIAIPKCNWFKHILLFIYQCLKNIYIRIIKFWYTRSIINKIRVIMIFYDTINYFFVSFIHDIMIAAVSVKLENKTSKLIEFGVTKKHIDRCEMITSEIYNEFNGQALFCIFVKFMAFPYILDGFIMPHIIGIIEKLHSRETSE